MEIWWKGRKEKRICLVREKFELRAAKVYLLNRAKLLKLLPQLRFSRVRGDVGDEERLVGVTGRVGIVVRVP